MPTLPRPLAMLTTVAALATLAAVVPLTLRAQSAPSSCAPVAASRGPAFVIGREGGNLRSDSTLIYADGRVVTGRVADTAGTTGTKADSARLDPLAVRALARLARTGGFWMLAMPDRQRPTRNPDAARALLAVHLSCGTRRLAFPPGTAPSAFAELRALVAAVTDAPR